MRIIYTSDRAALEREAERIRNATTCVHGIALDERCKKCAARFCSQDGALLNPMPNGGAYCARCDTRYDEDGNAY